jgi:molybdate transport system substrate-binding protein
LFSTNATLVTGEQTLRDAKFNKIAIADPAVAPYGAAAVETMKKLGLYETLSGKIVQGTDIGQAFQFVDTGSAEIGFVALSEVAGRSDGSRWIVPANLYNAILQDAVLLRSGVGNPAAEAPLGGKRRQECPGLPQRQPSPEKKRTTDKKSISLVENRDQVVPT